MVRRVVVAAALVDLAAVMVILTVFGVVFTWAEGLDAISQEQARADAPMDFAIFYYTVLFIGWVYRFAAIVFMRRSPGDWLLRLRVVEAESGEPASRLRMLGRDWLAGLFLALPAVNVLFVIRALTDSNGRGWHDGQVDTRVEVGSGGR